MGKFNVKIYVFVDKRINEELIDIWNKNEEALDKINITKRGQFKRHIMKLGIQKFRENQK